MWKTFEISRRRLWFDALEHRHLLSGGLDAMTGPGLAVTAAPRPQGPAWVAPMLVGNGGPGMNGPASGPRPDDLRPAENSGWPGPLPGAPHWNSPNDGLPPAPASPSPGNSSWASQPVSSPSTPGLQSSLTTPSGSGLAANGGVGTSGAASTAGSALSTPSPNPTNVGGPSANQPINVPSDNGLLLFLARTPDTTAQPGLVSAAPLSTSPGASGNGSHLEASSSGTLLLAMPNGPTGPTGPGTLATGAAVNGPAGAVPMTQVQQKAPGASTHHATHSMAGEPDGLADDARTSTNIGAVSRSVGRDLAAAGGNHAPGADETTASGSLLGLTSTDFDARRAVDQSSADAPLPHGADLIAEALPFPGESLERSLQDLVNQLDSGDMAGLVARGSTSALAASIAMAGASAASALVLREAARRRSGRRGGFRVFDPAGRELALSFPDLPRSWSLKR